MKREALQKIWQKEEEYVFSGWNFSHLEGRTEEEAIPWDYKNIVKNYLKSTDSLLDMGTGGGEFLLTLNHPHHLTTVTESYLPNVKLCEEKLRPLGIKVKQVNDDSNLPLDDNAFDIIINRHESFDLSEVYRTLKSGGVFITQQVGRLNNFEFSKVLLDKPDKMPKFENDLKSEISEAQLLGFQVIESDECFPYLRFLDIGALVYLAKIIEWEFEGFSVECCLDKLMEMHESVETEGYIESKEHRYLLVLKKR
ncbi:class I SAM-dependent methyltransferase [Fusibacter ferrireducens]|uniref:Class I SAM-dependent methyltransferase n=1 Tax=Fusibacter ferrireducens TaxID=2785058 RepID=A0ABR9ZNJ1_9FIRM|nr:class I SAM-dependent methyltransferase [Fusibacter ferrireducens]MBF4691974.1 class I SAM-dependent methyltransferase [Fusibacter ferrireducens]